MLGWFRAAIALASRSNRSLNCAAETFDRDVAIQTRVSRASKSYPGHQHNHLFFNEFESCAFPCALLDRLNRAVHRRRSNKK
jgi:hypothetical protein